MRGTTLQTPRSVQKEGEEVLQAPEQIPLQPMEVDGGADIHLQPTDDPTLGQVETPEGGCDPVGSQRWSRLLAGPVDP